MANSTATFAAATGSPDVASPTGPNFLSVVPGDAENSLLYKAIKGEVMCMNGSMTEKIARMPDDCPSKRECLTDAQIKTIGDWINAGAKM